MKSGFIYTKDDTLIGADLTGLSEGVEIFNNFLFKTLSTVIGIKRASNRQLIKKISSSEDLIFSIIIDIDKSRTEDANVKYTIKSPEFVDIVVINKPYANIDDFKIDMTYLVTDIIDKISTDEV